MNKRIDRSNASRFLIAVAALSASLLAASCGSNSSSSSTSASPPSSSTSAGSFTSTSPSSSSDVGTAEFTGLHEGSKVSFNQEVTGVITGFPSGMDAWLVVQPQSAPKFWPQNGPLLLDRNGKFHALAYFGSSATQNKGEKFDLLIVEASSDASQRFREFIKNPQGMGMDNLPDGGTTALAQIAVTRG